MHPAIQQLHAAANNLLPLLQRDLTPDEAIVKPAPEEGSDFFRIIRKHDWSGGFSSVMIEVFLLNNRVTVRRNTDDAQIRILFEFEPVVLPEGGLVFRDREGVISGADAVIAAATHFLAF